MRSNLQDVILLIEVGIIALYALVRLARKLP